MRGYLSTRRHYSRPVHSGNHIRAYLHYSRRRTPPARHQSPAGTRKLALALRGNDRVDRCGRADVEARLKVMRRRRQHKPVQRDNLFPRQLIGGAPASRPHRIPRKSRRSISAAKAIPTDRQLRSPLCVRAFLPRDAIHDPRQRLGVAKRRHCAAGHIACRKRPVCCC
jgi:hypothetical protein